MRRSLLLCATMLTATGLPAQWQILDAHTTADLRGIDNVGGGVAWASGTNGTVLRTEDAGVVWQLCAVPPGAEKLDFRGIQAFDANTAIVMSSGPGDASRLYKTTDGCQTWTLVFTNPDKDGFWDAIKASKNDAHTSAEVMVAGDPVGGSFTLFYLDIRLRGPAKSKLIPFPGLEHCPNEVLSRQLLLPAGDCITRLDKAVRDSFRSSATAAETGISEKYKSPVPRAGEALFAASNSSIALDPSVWYAPNISFVTGGPHGARFLQLRVPPPRCDGAGCAEWIKADIPLTASESAGAFSVAATGKNVWKGVIVGGDYKRPDESQGTAAFTTDEGKSWVASQTPPHGYRSAVAYDAAAKTWITVGPNGTDISTDDGRNWRALTPAPNEAPDADKRWNALSLPYVVGPHGRIGLLREERVQGAGPSVHKAK